MASVVHEKWAFQPLPTKQFASLEDSVVKELLMKWNMNATMQMKCFYYDKHFQAYQKDGFGRDFFQDPVVNSTLQVRSSSGQWAPLAIGHQVTKVDVEDVPCTFVTMEVFDKLFNEEVVRKSGSVCKCYDDFCEDIQISDELRKELQIVGKDPQTWLKQHIVLYKDCMQRSDLGMLMAAQTMMLLLEDSDNYDLFCTSDRAQLLFRVFKHICLGGPVCQFEDHIQPYMDTAKLLYKDLVSVMKDGRSGKLAVLSLVYKVQLWAGNDLIFPGTREHEQSFCYLIVDPHKRHVACWYHIW